MPTVRNDGDEQAKVEPRSRPSKRRKRAKRLRKRLVEAVELRPGLAVKEYFEGSGFSSTQTLRIALNELKADGVLRRDASRGWWLA
jgi:DNA-binding GntR family transcriptional regulator